MNTFRFVLYTWLWTIIAYPPLVLIFDILTRSNTEGRLFFPLLAGAFVLGIPGLLLGWMILSLLQQHPIPLLVQYCLWTAAVLFLIYASLSVWGLPGLFDIRGDLARFVLPLFGAALLVLLFRYPYYREIPISEY